MLTVLQKQYQLIMVHNNMLWDWFEEKKYAVKYKNSDKFADYLASKHINWINRDTWIDWVNIVPTDFKVVSFKHFREEIY